MPLEMRSTSKWWYGRFNANGKRYCKNLGVEIRGARPDKLSNKSNEAFEKSRARAEAKLEQLQEDAKKKGHSEELVQAIHEIRTGRRVSAIPLVNIADSWEKILRERPMSPRYVVWAKSVFKSLNLFIQANYPRVDDMAGVTHDIASNFMRHESQRGISPRSWNAELTLLRSAFRRLRREAGIAENPFIDMPKKEEDTLFHKPFTPEELKTILDAARNDDFIRPVIVTGICTAMRRGDCCLLKWSAVDLPSQFITIKVLKTGKPAQIPMFPMLHDELSRALPIRGEYVFPDQAAMYQSNPMGITLRVRRIFKTAGFSDDEKDDNHVAHVTSERKQGIRRVSVRDFHSFRTTWITLALSANVPMELVRKVTGHRTVDVVLEHYFQPGREDFRKIIETSMPKLLTSSQEPSTPTKLDANLLDEIIQKLQQQEPRNWREIRDALMKTLKQQ